jgi:subtilase family serine protease
MSIRFSGTASQVQSTFHTEIHNLSVKGAAHIGNMSDPQIPAALAPVVVGVKSLHNFFPRPLHRTGSQVTRDSASGKWARIPGTAAAGSKLNAAAVRPTTSGAGAGFPLGGDKTALTARPQFGINVGGTSPFLEEDVAPYDFATIYNVLPLWNASIPITGSGQTIAIAGTSGIVENDLATFRTFFGLPPMSIAGSPIANAPTFSNISGNSQPVTVCNSTTSTASCGQDDLVENSLDVQWSGSVAKGANIVLVSSFPSSSSDDNLYDSESYIVDNVTAHITMDSANWARALAAMSSTTICGRLRIQRESRCSWPRETRVRQAATTAGMKAELTCRMQPNLAFQ